MTAPRQSEDRSVCLVLPFPPTTNNLFAGKCWRYPSKRYREWKAEAKAQLMLQRWEAIGAGWPKFHQPVSLNFAFGRPDNRRRDLSNYIKAVEDLLVEYGILADDSLAEIISASWCLETIGVRVLIEPIDDIAADLEQAARAAGAV